MLNDVKKYSEIIIKLYWILSLRDLVKRKMAI